MDRSSRSRRAKREFIVVIITAHYPGSSRRFQIAWLLFVAAVPTILTPFLDIAMNLIKPPRVRFEAVNRQCFLPVFAL